jgi:hypothetical protein
MRELTKEQEELLALVATVKWREEAARNAAANEAAMAAARAEAERLRAIQKAQYEAEAARQGEAIRPLKEAMRAAGIKLSLSSYEGVWGSYQIGDGPEVDLDLDSFEVD